MDGPTLLEYWLLNLPVEVLALLAQTKMLSDLLVLVGVVVPSIVALFRPGGYLWVTTRLRAGVLLAAGVIWITAWYWITPLNDVIRFMYSLGPAEFPEPPPPPPVPILQSW